MSSVAVALEHDPDRHRALGLLRHHGWATVSFQVLESDFRYWFDGDDAVVGYVDTGAAWVVGGAPIAPAARLPEVTARFAAAARRAGRRASFFACEQRFLDAARLPAVKIGEQPIWSPADWAAAITRDASLRYQLSRARRKGVTVRAVTAAERADPTDPLHAAVAALARAWLGTRGMAPMGFLVRLEPLAFADERVVLVAEHDGAIVGLLSAAPVYARRRLFIEHVLRSPTAPNGTSELLIDAAMRAAGERGDGGVTLGLAPLAGDLGAPLRLARTLATPLYDFRGLHAFKAKLRPTAWEPVYLCAPARPWRALPDGLRAFAGGSLLGFGLRTLGHHRRWLAVAAAGLALVVALALVLALR